MTEPVMFGEGAAKRAVERMARSAEESGLWCAVCSECGTDAGHWLGEFFPGAPQLPKTLCCPRCANGLVTEGTFRWEFVPPIGGTS